MADDLRTPKDYAIEHAEYLAVNAERLMDALKERGALLLRRAESDDLDENDMYDAEQSVNEATTAVRNGIYEFRKRRDRAIAAPASPEAQEAHIPVGFKLVPVEPTAAMLIPIARSKFPEDWESGKRLQREQSARKVPFEDRVPFKTEYEIAVGQYQRMLHAAPAAQQERKPLSNWRAIETAPTDGTEILGCWQNEVSASVDVVIFSGGVWHHPGDADFRYSEPTCWQPVPAPPSPAEGERT